MLGHVEEKKLLDAVTPVYLKSMIRIFLNSGLRRKELFQLTWHNVNFQRRQIYITETKTGKNRYIPMNEAVYKELMRLYEARKDNGLVFVNPKTGRGYVCIRKAFQSACRRAEIDNLTLPDRLI
ncbi:MAG: site-specific integrase [Candidatus Aminicenantaceae bacterium]